MGGGIVAAQTTDSDDAVVNVTCPQTASIDVNVLGEFSVDATVGSAYYDAHLPGGFQMVMDLSCNWSNDFTVSADISTFNYQGTAPANTAASFGGSHLLLDNGSGVYTGPDIYLLAGPPNVEGSVFEFLQTNDPDVIENGHDTLLWFQIPVASPGITTATWDGHLLFLPYNLADGQYVAPLTVNLTVN